jgi:hypothetical protein
MNLLTVPIISLLPDHFPIRHSIFFVKKLMQCVLQIHSGICRCPRAREELPQGLQGAGTESHESAQQWGGQEGKLSPFCHFTNSGTQKRTTFLAFSRYGRIYSLGFNVKKLSAVILLRLHALFARTERIAKWNLYLVASGFRCVLYLQATKWCLLFKSASHWLRSASFVPHSLHSEFLSCGTSAAITHIVCSSRGVRSRGIRNTLDIYRTCLIQTLFVVSMCALRVAMT